MSFFIKKMNNINPKNFSSLEEIKQFFKNQVKKLHPDKGGDKEEFLALLNWYQEIKKKFQNKSVKVIKHYPLKGNYFFSLLELTVEEICLGGKKKIKAPGKEILCPYCKGTGKNQKGKIEICEFCEGSGIIEIKNKNELIKSKCPYCKGLGISLIDICPECKGKGKIIDYKEIWIDIPIGLKEGDILYIPKNEIDLDYDLYLEISIIPHPYFELNNGNLIYKCQIPFWKIILNEEILIYTLEGKDKILAEFFTKSPPIIIKGRGPFKRDGTRGDLLIYFQIYIPHKIPEKAKRLISEAVKIINSCP